MTLAQDMRLAIEGACAASPDLRITNTRYDIVDGSGNAILFDHWQERVRPGLRVSIRLWPIAHDEAIDVLATTVVAADGPTLSNVERDESNAEDTVRRSTEGTAHQGGDVPRQRTKRRNKRHSATSKQPTCSKFVLWAAGCRS